MEVDDSRLISVKQGMYYEWFENGKPKTEGEFNDNQQDGKWTYFYENGNKMYEQTLVKGRQEGKVTSWYAIGTLESEKEYKNGQAHGKWVFYAKQAGKVLKTAYYKEGKKIKEE
jgi:antitoxin component YwqK of YwqJK toxin-antitoxin module